MSESDDAITEWLDRAARELEGAHAAWGQGNAGKGRVCSRRAAGMALKARSGTGSASGLTSGGRFAAITNFRFLASDLWSTGEAIERVSAVE